ncbi:MAG: hypothetical protein ACK5V3_11425 [Bdellovibrionales bacterium]
MGKISRRDIMWMFKVITIILLLGTAWAQDNFDNESYFITHDQFVSLPQEKKTEWLKELHSIFSEMAETSDLMAYENLFSNSQNRSPAQATGVSEELKKLREQRKLEFLQSQGISTEAFQEIHKRVVSTPLAQRNSLDYQKDYATWKAAINYVNQREAEDRARERAAEEAELKVQQAREEAEKEKKDQEYIQRNKAAHEKFLAEQKLSRRERRALRAQEQKESERQQRLDQTRSNFRMSEIQNLNDNAPRNEDLCLFAGWIVNGRPCRGPSEMPEDIKFKGIDNNQLRCEKGTFLCNPLLFGVVAPKECPSLYFHEGQGDSPCLKKVKALCTGFSGGSPTRECSRLSAKTIDTAVELIGENDSKIFNEYRGRFFKLCHETFLNENRKIASQKNAQGLRTDVQRTCAVAKKRLEEVTYRLEKFIPLPPVRRPRPVGTESQR